MHTVRKVEKDYTELSAGGYEELLLTNRQFAYSRNYNGKVIVIALNNDDNETELTINPHVACNEAKIILDGSVEDKMRAWTVELKTEMSL